MKKTRQNNLIIGSDTLFNSRHKNGFYDLFKNDHDIFMLETNKPNYVNDLVESIKGHMSLDYTHKVFIGSGKDIYILFDLYLQYGIYFDAAVLVNGTYSNTIYMDEKTFRYKELVDGLSKKTEIYNLHGKLNKYEELPFAKINQKIDTYIPPTMSSRYSLEAYGLIVYGLYEQNGLSNSVGRVSYL